MVSSTNPIKSGNKIDAEVYSEPSDEINIIVQTNENMDLQSLSVGNSAKIFKSGKFTSLKISKDKLSQLQDSASVKKVWIDNLNKAALDFAVPLIQADKIWNAPLGPKIAAMRRLMNMK